MLYLYILIYNKGLGNILSIQYQNIFILLNIGIT